MPAETLNAQTDWWKNFRPALHATAKSHREAMERLRAMTPQQLLETSVRAGIHNPDGSLQSAYRSSED